MLLRSVHRAGRNASSCGRVRGRARQKLEALLASKLTTARAWELKETFSHIWSYKSVIWAGAFLDYWCFRAMRSPAADEESCSHAAPSRGTLAELVPRQRRDFHWYGRGPQQQDSSGDRGDQTILRIPYRRRYGNGPLSHAGTTSRTRISPKILLRRPKCHPFDSLSKSRQRPPLSTTGA